MGQVQSVEEAVIDGEAGIAASGGAEGASGTPETFARETALSASPKTLSGQAVGSPLKVEMRSKNAVPSPVEQGDMGLENERSPTRDIRQTKKMEERTPAAGTRPASERRNQRQGRSRSRRSHRDRGAARSPTPVALMVSAALTPTDVSATLAGDVATEDAEGWSSEPEGASAPRATILVAGSRKRKVACAGIIACCFAAVVAALTYGAIKSISHHGLIAEKFENWTIARMARSGAAAVNTTTTTISAAVNAANFFEAGVNFTFSDEPPTGKRN